MPPCTERPTECKDDFEEIKKAIKELHDKLFIGNGQPPITVQIDRLNTFKATAYWTMGIISVAVVALVSRLVYTVMFN